jgi:spore maturation protein CgeB
MNILFALPGHLKTVPMGRYCIEALQELGHRVTPFDYRPGLLDKLADRYAGKTTGEEKAATNRRFRRLVNKCRPDVMITLFGFDLSRESLEQLRAMGVPSVCWWINDPFQFERSRRKAGWYDHLFTNSAGCVEQYRAQGVEHVHFLPTACHPAVHRPVPPVSAYACDVCFAGDWSPLREELMTRLAGQFDLRIFGPWKKKLAPGSHLASRITDGFFTPEQMAAMFSSAKLTVNLHTWFGQHDHGVNPRLFEAAACGVYQVVDWKREIPELFSCTDEIACYRSLDEVASLIQHAMDAPSWRAECAATARAHALAAHTYRHRMQELLDKVGA